MSDFLCIRRKGSKLLLGVVEPIPHRHGIERQVVPSQQVSARPQLDMRNMLRATCTPRTPLALSDSGTKGGKVLEPGERMGADAEAGAICGTWSLVRDQAVETTSLNHQLQERG
jgi:hypothetical protein